MTFDKNYLDHELIPTNKYGINNDFICKKCNVELHYASASSLIDDDDSYYFIKTLYGEKFGLISNAVDGVCTINCEEYIIKNIIE